MEERMAKEKLKGKNAFKPLSRERKISSALRAYASLVSSADKGAIRNI
jgi:dihydroxy-acid dehydratase